jgi:hypothetical protein
LTLTVPTGSSRQACWAWLIEPVSTVAASPYGEPAARARASAERVDDDHRRDRAERLLAQHRHVVAAAGQHVAGSRRPGRPAPSAGEHQRAVLDRRR